jgi:hypothetical protein
MKKQTAVGWLVDELLSGRVLLPHLIQQAKAMEKAQHQTSFDKGYDRRNYIHDFEYGGVEYWEEEPKEFKEYYKENYGL